MPACQVLHQRGGPTMDCTRRQDGDRGKVTLSEPFLLRPMERMERYGNPWQQEIRGIRHRPYLHLSDNKAYPRTEAQRLQGGLPQHLAL